MAIDTRAKRASVVALGLAFMGPSVFIDGSISAQADRQTIGYSYYGILASSGNSLGATSQLAPFNATGGITLERTIGGTAQLLAFDASGGITLEKTLGATSQLNPFTSSGGIQVGDVAVESEEANSGGYSLWIAYEQEMLRREDERKRRAKEKKKAQKIKDKLDKELALAERALEEEDARKAELARLNRLVAQQKGAIIALRDERLTYIMTEALERQTFSAIERLERSLAKMHKEDMEFLLLATEILVNQ